MYISDDPAVKTSICDQQVLRRSPICGRGRRTFLDRQGRRHLMAAVIESDRACVATAPSLIPNFKSNNRRATLKVLDACLTAIEDATERGDSVISPSLAMQIRKHVPSVVPGGPIVAAHKAVLSRQAVLLASRGELVPLGETDSELTEEQARRLC